MFGVLDVIVNTTPDLLTAPDQHIASIQPMAVQLLGPEYSFSYMLGQILFDGPDRSRRSSIDLHKSLSDAARTTRLVPRSIGLLPVENTTTSPVQSVTDDLLTGDFNVLAEATLKIELVLAGVQGATREDIKQIYSHSKPFGQAPNFIDGMPRKIEIIERDSTSEAAREVAGLCDPSVAALCGRTAAKHYKLSLIDEGEEGEGVQDVPDNRTRFLIVEARRNKPPVDLDQLLPHRPNRGITAKVAGIVSPKEPGLAGLVKAGEFIIERNIDARDMLCQKNDPAKPGGKDYFMEFVGNSDALWNTFKKSRAHLYKDIMEFRLLGAYPLGSTYVE